MKEEPKRRHWALAAVLMAAAVFLCVTAAGSGAAAASAAVKLAVPTGTPAATGAAGLKPGDKVVPLGRAVGIKLFSDGVLVVGLSELDTGEGKQSPGRACGLKTGDVITHINGQEVDTIEAVQTILREQGDKPLKLQADRSGRALQLSAQAVKNDQGGYQLGVWLRDSMAGIGTMTFYEPDSGVFAALGHGINDVDTAKLMPLESGSLMYATVAGVARGEPGIPGELHGDFDVARDLGTLYANTDRGIYGVLTGDEFTGGTALEVAARDQVHTGKASILSNVEGDEVREYEVVITHIYPASEGETRNLMLQVTDAVLLEKTGGIVQGMSGSPILQDGRLVGAVTHVLVNDPTRGYGVLAENMIQAAAAAA